MNAPTKDCDHRRIDDFLDSNRVGLEDEQLLEHLNTCTACREYMETRAADSDSWTAAASLLQPGEFDHASSDEYSLATIGSGRVDPPAAIQSVLDLLSPSEEPSRLGRLGTYEVSGVIGAGGMGVVLKAIDPALDRVVAIKVLAPHLAHSGTARRRFSREAKAAAAVLHPNVIPIHSVSSDERIPYLVMAYIRGGSLQKRLDREGPLSTVEILRIGSQVAAGLAAAHEQGLVHRDVKPENILLEEGVERITLTDFGLARAVDDASVTQPGTIAGTPQYMSPEQTRGEPIDQQSDLFSLGCVLYALCTGHPPFRADSSYAVMRKISDDSPMPIRELNPEIPEWLCAIIDKLMAKKKTDRFKSAHEVHELLEACLGHAQQPTVTKLPEIPRVRPSSNQPQAIRILIGVLAMSAVVACVLFGMIFFGNMPQDQTNGQNNQPVAAEQDHNIKLGESRKPGPVIIQQPFEIHIHKDATKPSKLEDGDYTLQITHTAKHPKVRFPTDAIPAAEYKKVDEPASVVRFSDDLKTLKLAGFGGIGGLESRAGDMLVYTFDRGLDDSGGPSAQVIVKKSDKGITVTLIQFGSGVPVIVSHKGTLKIATESPRGDAGVPVASQPEQWSKEEVAAAFKRLYQLRIAVIQVNTSLVQTIQDEVTAEQAAQDVAKLFPLKAEIRYLERALRDFGVGPDQQLYDDFKQQSDKLSAAYVKLAVKVKDQPYFELFNTAFIETSRGTTTLKPYSIPEGHAQRSDGPQFVIWLPAGATPEINLSAENGTLEVLVVDEMTGKLRQQRQTITCGGKALLPFPDGNDGSLYWLRAVSESNSADSDSQQSERPTKPEPLTWKALLGKQPPEGYSADALTLIQALNNSRGEWIFAGEIKREDTKTEFEAAVEIQGGFKNMIRQDSFSQWQIVIAWPREEPTNGLLLNVMALPEPDGIKWMLAPQYSSKDGGPVPGRHKMYEGDWNAETATVTWTSKQVRSPLRKDAAAEEPAQPKAAFDMVVKANGEIQFTGYKHKESLEFSGKAAARVGEPFVEKEPAIAKLPGGYKLFFASRLEVCLEPESGPIIAGPRIEKIGCEGNVIFGLIAKYVDPERSDTPGYFWLDTTTGKITKGMELAAWREALKSKGVSEPRLFAPDSVGEQN